MSTQLYSNWLSTARPKCFLPFPLPSRINLPKEYQPGLEARLRELTVDFSLEERILAESLKPQGLPSGSDNLQALDETLAEASLSESDLANQNKSTPNHISAKSSKEKQKSEEIMNNVLDQFDTLGLQTEVASEEINTHLAELFSKTVSPSNPPPYNGPSTSRNAPPVPFTMKMPTPGQQFDASFDYHTSNFLPHSPSKFQQVPYGSPSRPQYFPPTPGQNSAPSLPHPPMPLPKPIRCSSDSELTNSLISENLAQLVSMGFPESRAAAALSACGNNLDKAIEALLEDS
ncbi:hypothetical protein DSO57_1026966 [Entomophthora muscae]|uniref:Uncharacterized protein n=1 Tax=Entomophthora muscae TaxID=34485 RepID=A0ACC2UCQ3_9FUNG|nr:hypothetical protein DSO57_1026966 [Entomophthora muscae]